MSDNVKNPIKRVVQKEDPPNVTDFNKFLPWACKQYCIEMNVFVGKTSQITQRNAEALEKKHSRKFKQSKVVKSLVRPENDSVSNSESSSEVSIDLTRAVVIETFYDIHENLIQLKFLNNKVIPSIVMKVIALAIPYHIHLASITIDSGLQMETLNEISKFLPDSNITELCLDNTFISKANYHTLLTDSKLKYLSLAKCSINDDVVKMLTDQLVPPQPAAKVLSALNLSSNRITDDGAKHIADMLRINRQLSYLNLAGNMITDKGGSRIFNTLQKFPVGAEELLDSRVKYVAYIRERNELIKTFIKELQAEEHKNIKKKHLKKPPEKHLKQSGSSSHAQIDLESDARTIPEKAAYLAERKMGPLDEHFSPNNTESQDGVVQCFGNNTLCCLNLAYNSLTYISVKKLRDVLVTQRSLNRTPKGLVKVVIEGNLMPVDCDEYVEINRLLESRLDGYKPHVEVVTKKKNLSGGSHSKMKVLNKS